MECAAKQLLWNCEGRKVGDSVSYKCSCRCLSRGHSCQLLATPTQPSAKFSICARVTDPAVKILIMCANYLSQPEKGGTGKVHV